MKINYFFRRYNSQQISIEKLFNTIIDGVSSSKIITQKVINPYPLSFIGIIKSLFFFKNNQGDINHITGDIHWACFLLNKKKTVLTIHDLVGLTQYEGFKKWIYYMIWVYLPIKKLKYITTISEKTKKEIISLIPSSENKIRVIHNCLTAPIKHGFNENSFSQYLNVLIVGTRENKNIERTLIALKDLPINLSIIGKMTDSQLSLAQEIKLRMCNKIEISEEEILFEYSKANILCFASLYEGFGLPILEAQAQNCCVITSNVSPMKEVAGDGAFFVNPYEISDIRNALIQLIKNKELRTDLIVKGKKNIENYSLNKINEKYINLYKEILNHDTTRRSIY